MSATVVVVASKPVDSPSSCRCTACVTVSCNEAVSRARPAIVASMTGCSAAPAARALSATLVLQRLLHRRSEARVGGLGLAVEGVLAGDLPLVQRQALLLDGRHHRLQPIDQRGHHLGLPLQELEGFLALMGLRVDAQGRRDLHVEQLRGLDPLAPAQRGKQPQHGGGGHARNRGAERKSQSLDRCGQRRADSLQVRRAFQRHAGAAQRRHHAQQRAEHAQQHQQADQIRRQRRAGQGHALTFDAQAHRVAQAGMQCARARRPGWAAVRTGP